VGGENADGDGGGYPLVSGHAPGGGELNLVVARPGPQKPNAGNFKKLTNLSGNGFRAWTVLAAVVQRGRGKTNPPPGGGAWGSPHICAGFFPPDSAKTRRGGAGGGFLPGGGPGRAWLSAPGGRKKKCPPQPVALRIREPGPEAPSHPPGNKFSAPSAWKNGGLARQGMFRGRGGGVQLTMAAENPEGRVH